MKIRGKSKEQLRKYLARMKARGDGDSVKARHVRGRLRLGKWQMT